MKIGKIIRNARTHRGLTQPELAKALGVSTNYISLLENDHRDPSWRFVNELADAVRIPLPLLLLRAYGDVDLDDEESVRSLVTSELIALADAVHADEN